MNKTMYKIKYLISSMIVLLIFGVQVHAQSLTGTTSVCTNSATPPTETYQSDAGQTSYIWSVSGNSGTDYNIVSGGTSTDAQIVIEWYNAGTFTIDVTNDLGTAPQLTVVVAAEPTLTLYTAGADNQTICANAPLTNIEYVLGGGATGATVDGLPNGITFETNAGVVTIMGTTQGVGTYNYSVLTSGQATSCTPAELTGTIVVDPAPSISASPAAICDGGTLDLSTVVTRDAGVTLEFYSDAAGTAVITSTVSPTTDSTFFVRGTGTNTCQSEIIPINVTVGVTPTFTVNATNACAGAPINLETGISDLTENSTLRFYSDAAGTVLITDDHTAIVLEADSTFYVRAIGNASACLSDVQTMTVTVNPAPTFDAAPGTLCAGDSIDLTTLVTNISAGSTARYYSDALATSELTNTFVKPLVTSNYYVRSSDDVTNCMSEIVPVQITVNPLPTFSVNNATTCPNVPVNLNALVTLNTENSEARFYSDEEATTQITEEEITLTADTTLYTRSVDTITGCQSAIVPLDITVTPAPTFTLAATDTAICEGSAINLQGIVTNLSENSTARFYSDAAATVLLGSETLTPQTDTTVYVKAIGNATLCESAIETLNITVTPLPVLTTTPSTICQFDSVDLATLVTPAAGSTVRYYSDAQAASELTNTFVKPVVTSNYYARATDDATNCMSTIHPIAITVNPAPTFVTLDTTICVNSSLDLTLLVHTISGNSTVAFYSDAEATTAISGSEVTAGSDTVFYVRSQENTTLCYSQISAINVTTTEAPTFVVTDPAAVCAGESVDLTTTVSDISAGSTVGYYSNAEATIVLSNTTIVANTDTVFYVKSTNGGCESAITPINVTATPAPTFTVVPPSAICTGSSIDLNVVVTGQSANSVLFFYSDAEATQQLSSATVTPTATTTYYIRSQEESSLCWSAIQSVLIDVVLSPAATVTSPSVCEGADLTLDTVVTDIPENSVPHFYVDATATTELTSTTVTPMNDTIFYVQLHDTVTNCRSTIDPINVTIMALPTFTLTSPITGCGGMSIDLLTAISDISTGAVINYYSDAAGTTELSSSMVVVENDSVFYVRAENAAGCMSAIEALTVNATPAPTFTVVAPAGVCEGDGVNLNSTVTNLSANSTAYFYSDAAATQEITNPMVNPTVTTTYYIQSEENTSLCRSAIMPVVITITPRPTFTVNPLAICEGTPANLDFAIHGLTTNTTAHFYSDEAATVELPSAIVTPDTTTDYYVRALYNDPAITCPSIIDTIRVEVRYIPTFDISATASICGTSSLDLNTVVDTVSPGATVHFYSDAAATMELASPIITSAVDTTFYLRAIDNVATCESAIQSVLVQISAAPTFTVADTTVCDGITFNLGNTVTDLTPNSTARYYSDAEATVELSSSDVEINGTTTYYVRAQENTTLCWSIIQPVVVTANPAPEVVVSNANLCTSEQIDLVDYIESFTAGSTVRFFSDAAATVELTSTVMTPTVDTTFYVRAEFSNDCMSPVMPLAITIGVGPEFTYPASYTICGQSPLDLNSIISDIPVNSEVHFYSDAAASNELASSVVVPNTDTVFYMRAQDTLQNCWGPIVSTQISMATIPTFVVTNPASICGGASIDLADAVSGETPSTIVLHYYSDAAASNELSSSIVTPTETTTYYARAIENTTTCWSAIQPIVVTATPAPEVVVSPINLCASQEIDLADYVESFTSGSTVRFYSDAAATQELATTVVTPTVDITYYVRAEFSAACVSNIVPLVITIGVGPEFTYPATYAVCGEGSLDLNEIISAIPENSVVHFYSDATANNELASSVVMPTTDTIFYMRAQDTLQDCWGAIVSTQITLSPAPTFVVTNPAAICGGASVNLTDAISSESANSTVRFYSNSTATEELASSVVNPSETNTYYAQSTDSVTNCMSEIQSITVTVSPAPTFTVTPIGICEAGSVNLTEAISNISTGATVHYYSDAAATQELNNTTVNVSADVTYYVRAINGSNCWSEIMPLAVTIDGSIGTPTISANQTSFCNQGTLRLTATVNGDNINYQWYLNDNAIEGATSSIYEVAVQLSHSGTYFVEVSNGCGTERSNTIDIDVRSSSMLREKWNDVILVDNSSNEYTAYQWYKNGARIDGATNQFYQEKGGLNGTYYVELTSTSGSKMLSCEVTLNKAKSVEFKVYPNPVVKGESVNAEIAHELTKYDGVLNISVYDTHGKEVMKKVSQGGQFSIETSNLTSGLYVIIVTTENGSTYNEKMIVR